MARADRYMSLQAVARHLRRHRDTVSKWISEGCPAQSEGDAARGLSWKLNLAEVVGWIVDRERRKTEERLDSKHAREVEALRAALARVDGEDGEVISHSEAKRREAVAKARQAELDLAFREGELIREDEATANGIAISMLIRQHMMNLPSRVAQLVASIDTPAECEEVVREHVYAAMHEVADAKIVHAGHIAEIGPEEQEELCDFLGQDVPIGAGAAVYLFVLPPRKEDGSVRGPGEGVA